MVPAICKRAALLWLFVLTACTIQLAPNYDQALVDGLDRNNVAALTLFAAVESGSPSSQFGDYEQRYAELIGSFEALRQRAASRQIPPLAKRISTLGLVQDFCNSETDPTGCVNASPASLQRAIDVLRKMRDRHRSPGLAPDIVQLFRTDYDTAMGQALTVENALRR